MKTSSLVFTFLLFFVSDVYASSQSFVMCKTGSQRRYSRIETVTSGDESHCLLLYTKLGKDKVSAKGKYYATCSGAQERLVNKLVASGWDCGKRKGLSVIGAQPGQLSTQHLQ